MLSPLWALLSAILPAQAAQPIFDEMPRWSNGWGVQVIEERRHERALLGEGTVLSDEQTETLHLLHVEGVYTWHRSIRMTAKLPVVLQAERVAEDGTTQTSSGLGDFILAVPLKRYFNLDGRSGSWTAAPQLRIPLEPAAGEAAVPHTWGGGLGLGYETETYRYILGAGVDAWALQTNLPNQVSGTVSMGLNYVVGNVSGHIKWKCQGVYRQDASATVRTGPTFYIRLTDRFHAQLQGQVAVFDRAFVPRYGQGSRLRGGLAVVF